MNTPKTALLFGATGLVGSHVLTFLLKSKHYDKVIAFTRRPLSITDPKLLNSVINFDNVTEIANTIKGDDIFLCLGTTIKKAGSQAAFRKVDFEYPLAVAQIAIKNQVQQVLLCSAVDANSQSRIFYNRVKGELEDALKALPFNRIHIFQPSLLLGERTESRIMETIAQSLLKPLDGVIGHWLGKYRPVSGEKVALAMVKAANNDSPTGVQYYASDAMASIYLSF